MSEPTSIWKKEIRLGRRSRLEQAVEEAMETAPPTAAEANIGKPSLWKKEFHIGSAPGDNPSFWKKDIRLFAPRKPGDDDAVAVSPAPAHAPVENSTPTPELAPEPALAHEPPAPVFDQPAAAPAPAPEQPPAPIFEQPPVAPAQPVTAFQPLSQPSAFEPSHEPMPQQAPPAPGRGVTLEEIDARIEAAKAVLAATGVKPAPAAAQPEPMPAPIRQPQPELAYEPAASIVEQPPVAPEREQPAVAFDPVPEPLAFDPLSQPAHQQAPFVPGRGVTLDEIDARLEAARAALAATELKPIPAQALEPAPVAEPEPSYKPAAPLLEQPPVAPEREQPVVAFEPSPEPTDERSASVSEQRVVAPEPPPAHPEPLTPPHVATLEELDARIRAAKAAADVLEVKPTPVVPEPTAPLEPELSSEPKFEPPTPEPEALRPEPQVAPVPAAVQSAALEPVQYVEPARVREAPFVAAEPQPTVAAPEPTPEPSRDLTELFEPRANAAPDEIDARLAAAKAAFVSAISPPAPEPATAQEPEPPAVTQQVTVPQPADPELEPELEPEPELDPGLELEPEPEPEPALEPSPEPAAQPFWKKEIGRSSKSKAAPAPKAERAPKAASQPFWKKEISLGRSAKAKPEPEPKPEPAAKAASQPFWKKEIGRSSKSKAAPAAKAERAPKSEAQPFWKKEIGRSSKSKAAPAPKSERAPKAASQPFWKKEISLGRSTKSQPEPPLELEPVAEHEPADEAAPSSKRAPQPASQPFWKKEIGRSSKSKAAPAAKAERAPKAASQPFWKKEIGRSSKSKAAPAAKAERAPKAASQPFWKKEIGRSSKSKAAPAAKAERAPKAASQPFWKKEIGRSSKSKQATAAPQSLAKRELRMPSLKRSVGDGGHDGPRVAQVVGLRIGSSQLGAALVNNNGTAELLQLASTPLEPGIVADGEVRDPVALGSALKRFFAQNRLPRSGVRLGIATNRIGVRVLEVPVVDDPQLLANAIRFRAQEVLPIPLADAVLDHVVLGESKDSSGVTQQRLLLVFAHRELVDGYLDACGRAGLKLLGIDFDAFALLRALSEKTDESAEKQSALVAVAIGRERTIFAVSDGSICDFTRVLEWGGASLDAALASALNIDLEEAEHVKRTLSLTGDETVGELSAIQVEAARAALREEIQVLSRELVSSLQFYQSRSESLDIGDVLLTGGGAQLGGIEAELSRQLGVPVRIGDPLGCVTVGESVITPADAGSLTIAVGLGIQD